MADFGKLLKNFRERAELSQSALAQAAGIDRSYICRLENGEREVTSRSLALNLADILDLSLPEVDLWLISAGYISPRMQELAAGGVSKLLDEINVLSETTDAGST